MLVFCEYVATVDELVATLTAEGIGCVSLTGSDSTGKRQAAVDRFQGEAAARVFIGTSGAAGVGITLTAANVVMFAGLPWTPLWGQQLLDGTLAQYPVLVVPGCGCLSLDPSRTCSARSGSRWRRSCA